VGDPVRLRVPGGDGDAERLRVSAGEREEDPEAEPPAALPST